MLSLKKICCTKLINESTPIQGNGGLLSLRFYSENKKYYNWLYPYSIYTRLTWIPIKLFFETAEALILENKKCQQKLRDFSQNRPVDFFTLAKPKQSSSTHIHTSLMIIDIYSEKDSGLIDFVKKAIKARMSFHDTDIIYMKVKDVRLTHLCAYHDESQPDSLVLIFLAKGILLPRAEVAQYTNMGKRRYKKTEPSVPILAREEEICLKILVENASWSHGFRASPVI